MRYTEGRTPVCRTKAADKAPAPAVKDGARRAAGVVARPLRGWPTRRISVLLWPDLMRSAPIDALLAALGTAARGLGLGAAV